MSVAPRQHDGRSRGELPGYAEIAAVFREVRLPEGKVLIPGVVDSTSNYIEPMAVAQRSGRYADVVGRERVVAGTGCGFFTFSGFCAVHPHIARAKLAALVESARIASRQLWRTAT